jgi:Trm5-related predicted tRNA methylase
MEKRKEFMATMSESNQSESLCHRSIFATLEMKFNPQRLLNLYALVQAARLGDFFIIDGGFEFAHARHSYFSSLIQRVFRCFKNIDRFHSPSYIIISDLSNNFQTFKHPLPHEHSSYFQSTRELYIDLFNKDRFIYLTPDSPNEMTHFDHDAIYILGGIYDDENKEPLTYQKALRQNIRHQKLPLEKYLT